jgi:hypothetical protein
MQTTTNTIDPAATASPNAVSPTPANQKSLSSGVRYFGETVLPMDDGGVIKFSPSGMKAQELLTFAQNENEAINANPFFPIPIPSLADMTTALNALQADVTAWNQARIAVRDTSSRVEASRSIVESLMKMRANYVQATSNGNTNAIVSAGFLVRNAPAPVGDLPAPVGLLLTLNGTPGVMFLEWSPVAYARSYNLQMSPAETLERNWQPFRVTSTVRQKMDGMELGKTYAFRVAAIGGASGQSDWSAEVVRMAA